jgi:hypothetical protein
MSPYVADESTIVEMVKALAWCSQPMNAKERDWCLFFDGRFSPEDIKRLGEQAGRNAEAERKLRLARAI